MRMGLELCFISRIKILKTFTNSIVESVYATVFNVFKEFVY